MVEPLAAIAMLEFEQQVLDVESKVLHALVSLVTVLLEGFSKDTLKLDRSIWQYLHDWHRVLINDCCESVSSGRTAERHCARQHFVQHDTEAPDVAAFIDV